MNVIDVERHNSLVIYCFHRFYCTKQLPGFPTQFVTSSKVNDGICDCCDGSDEWFGALVPDFMRIEGKWHINAFVLKY